MSRAMKDSGVAWIGEIPEEWSCIRCKSILNANDGGVWGNDPTGEETDKIVIRSTEQTIDGKWCITDPATRDLRSIDCSKARIMVDDLLITKSSGSDLHIGKTTIADSYFAKHECYFSNFIQRIRCKDYVPKLLWYLFNSPIIREQCVYLQNSTSGIGNINSDIIRNLCIPLPPIVEQSRIAAHLDRRCAEIDRVIAATQRTIEEYKKLKQSIITEAVTHGVRGPRKMKDSGVERIGEIPEEWEVIRNVFLFKENVREPDADAIQLSLSQVDGLIATDDMKESSLKTSTYDGWKQVRLNDLVLNRFKGHLGVIYSATIEGMVSFHYGVFQAIVSLNSKYYEYLYHSDGYKAILGLKSNGMTVGLQNLSNANFYSVYSLFPAVQEQDEIVNYLDRRCAEIKRLLESKQQLLTQLESYKKSVIYEYVTGKKETPYEAV